MDEFDDFRRLADERERLISDLRSQGAVELDIRPGVGFASKPKVFRKAGNGGGSGQYIGGSDAIYETYGKGRKH